MFAEINRVEYRSASSMTRILANPARAADEAVDALMTGTSTELWGVSSTSKGPSMMSTTFKIGNGQCIGRKYFGGRVP